ncbi:MAG: hypothetical protein II942_00010 [Alphaproteobacteria bacterium]|nr:hypothetical protein [Alphaproteobacteria bacterium]
MRKLVFLCLTAVVLTSIPVQAEYVRGHYRSNGTWVDGYNRSNRNGTKLDNYSTQGNYNPYTGKKGTHSAW